jgi:hypothetical protein
MYVKARRSRFWDVHPQLVSLLGNPKPIEEIGWCIVPVAQRNALEIGVGPGVNFPHYDRAKVNKVYVYALGPNRRMRRRAEEQRRRSQLEIEFLNLPGERDRRGADQPGWAWKRASHC